MALDPERAKTAQSTENIEEAEFYCSAPEFVLISISCKVREA